MARKRQRIYPMKEGLEKEIMRFILRQIKNEPGLLHFINQHGGINAKWLNEDICYNISVHTFLKLLFVKFLYQTYDDSAQDWQDIYIQILNRSTKIHRTKRITYI